VSTDQPASDEGVEAALKLQADARLRARAQGWAKTALMHRHKAEYDLLYQTRLAELRRNGD